MGGILDGQVALVTGGGRGIGRAHALALAAAGAAVVVNDLGVGLHGEAAADDPANVVVDMIAAAGGRAVANRDDVADEAGAHRAIDTAVETFGGIDIIVNNAGILRDAMLFNMTVEQWDDVLRVHLRSTFLTSSYAARIWRAKVKAGGPGYGRIINTSSGAGLFGNAGQANYGAAKAAIAGFTLVAAAELARYGVTVNALAPVSVSRMAEFATAPETAQLLPPEAIARVAVWLASPEAQAVTGRVIFAAGEEIAIYEGWSSGPSALVPLATPITQLGAAITDLLARARPGERPSAPSVLRGD